MGTYEGKSSTASLWALLILAVAPTVLSDAVLTSSEEQVCPGKSVIFTCITTGSSTLAWESDEYIGAGSQFEFRSIDNIGDIESNSDAVATLTASDTTDGVLRLTSTLRIVSRPNTQNVSVSCRNVGLGRTNTSTIPLAAVPGAPQNVRAAETTQPVNSMCIILVTWDSPTDILQSDINHYTIYVSSGSTVNETTAIAILRVSNCRSNDISIQVATVTQFGCVGQNSSEVRPILLIDNTQTAPPTDHSEDLNVTPEPVDDSATSNSVVPALAAVFAVTFVLLLILTTSIVLFFVFKGRNRSAVKYQRTNEDDGEPIIIIPDIPGTTEEKRKEYYQMAEEEEDAKQIIQENLKEVYEALKAEVQDKNLLQKAVKQLSEQLEKPYASGHIVRKALKNTVKTIRRKHGEEFRRALDTLKDSVDISSVSGGMKDIVKMLHTTVGTDDHEEAIAELKNVLMVWVKSDEIKVCLQKLCDKLLEDESQKHLQELCEKLEDKSNYENLEDESKLNTTVITTVEDDEAYM